MNTKPFLRLLSILTLLGAPAFAQDEAPLELDAFHEIPVLFNGRHMPMDTYARRTLFQFSGKQSVEKIPASQWMAELLFTPDQTSSYPIFLINHPEVAEAIDIEPKDSRRYSYTDLHQHAEKLMEKAMQIDSIAAEDRSPVEEELLRTASNMQMLSSLMQTFSFTLEHPDFQPIAEGVHEKLETDGSPLDPLTLALSIGKVQVEIERLAKTPPTEWSALESDLFRLAKTLYDWSQRLSGGQLQILPSFPHDRDQWLDPWTAMSTSLKDKEIRSVMVALSTMKRAWNEKNQDTFDFSAEAVSSFTSGRLPGDREIKMIAREVRYNEANHFLWSKMLYFPGFLFGFAAFLSPKKWTRRIGWILIAGALAYHTVGMGMRMWIMGRPPVTNLYATFVFVSWICVVLSLIMERFQKNGLGLLAAGFSGISLLMLATRFATESDTLGKVVAVLDSNFWLSTHVLSITTGYAGCVLAAVIAHVYLFQAIFQPKERKKLMATERTVFAVLGFGLIFSFLGTMLGGVWADQSWGRFWGWDPKENGALLIVLWCAVLFHARLGGMVKSIGFAVGTGIGSIIVMFAWLGVNLLGVGLHSYGFTSGLARGLYTYTVLQFILLIVLGLAATKRASQS